MRVPYDPKLPFYRVEGGRKEHRGGLVASARDGMLHVGEQEKDGVPTRAVIDLTR